MEHPDQTGAMDKVGGETSGPKDQPAEASPTPPAPPSIQDVKPPQAGPADPFSEPSTSIAEEGEEPETPEKKRKRKSIRTYYDDIANAVKRQGVSVTKMVLAERKRKEKQQAVKEIVKKDRVMKVAPIHPPKEEVQEGESGDHWVIVLVSILLVIAGAGVLYYLYINSLGEEPEPPAPAISNEFMLVNRVSKLDITNATRAEIISSIKEKGREEDISRGDVTNIPVVTSFVHPETEDLIEAPAEARGFLEVLDTDIDLALMRSIEDEFMLGIYSSDKDRPFVILRTSFFENAFAGLLRWENSIESDLSFIAVDKKTETIEESDGNEGGGTPLSEFVDIVIANRDARALIDGETDVIRVIYSFPDKNTLVITSNAETLKEIFERLSTSRFE